MSEKICGKNGIPHKQNSHNIGMNLLKNIFERVLLDTNLDVSVSTPGYIVLHHEVTALNGNNLMNSKSEIVTSLDSLCEGDNASNVTITSDSIEVRVNNRTTWAFYPQNDINVFECIMSNILPL